MTLLRNAALTDWQVSYASEPPHRLTAGHPAVIEDAIEATRVGVDLAEAFMRFLFGSGGRDFPVHDALMRWERHCRARHGRWADHRGRPVCAEIAWAVIRDRTSLWWAAEFTEVSWDRAERLLDLGMRFMGREQARWMESEEEKGSQVRLRAAGVW